MEHLLHRLYGVDPLYTSIWQRINFIPKTEQLDLQFLVQQICDSH